MIYTRNKVRAYEQLLIEDLSIVLQQCGKLTKRTDTTFLGSVFYTGGTPTILIKFNLSLVQ